MTDTVMCDLEKLEMIHCAIQEVIKLDLPSGLDEEMDNALALVEELREPYLHADEQLKNSLAFMHWVCMTVDPDMGSPLSSHQKIEQMHALAQDAMNRHNKLISESQV